MTFEELKEDLLSLVSYEPDNYTYFSKKLFKSDLITYRRRSFDDLFKYYQLKDITELQLAQALYDLGFRGKICGDLHKFTFFMYPNPIKKTLITQSCSYLSLHDHNIKNSKYNVTYFRELEKQMNL